MNKHELIKKYETKGEQLKEFPVVAIGDVLKNLRELDESKSGHADEAPRYVKNVLARLRALPLHNREVWLEAIMSEFGQDFSNAKWREGYEQGKLEGAWVGNQLKDADKIRQELNKPVIPQFVADWIEEAREITYNIRGAIEMAPNGRVKDWLELKNVNIFAEAWVNGYAVEKEKRYLVKLKGIFKGCEYLNFKFGRVWTFSNEEENEEYRTRHTKKELEDAGFGWVFDCPGIQIEEVKD